MTDKEYNAEKARIQSMIDKWFNALGLGWYEVDMSWSREVDESHRDTAARTEWRWQYRTAAITWFLPTTATLTEEKLERTVVHEFAHILTGSMAYDTDDDGYLERMEHATETVARAIIWSRLAGREDVKKKSTNATHRQKSD